MKKRICYDYYFMSADPHNGFELKGERIVGASLMVEFKIFINGKEILYEGHDDEKEIFSYGSKKFYPANFVSFNNTGNKPAQNLCYCLIDATE